MHVWSWASTLHGPTELLGSEASDLQGDMTARNLGTICLAMTKGQEQDSHFTYELSNGCYHHYFTGEGIEAHGGCLSHSGFLTKDVLDHCCPQACLRLQMFSTV